MPDIEMNKYVKCRHCGASIRYGDARTDNGVHFCRKCYIRMYGTAGIRNESVKRNGDPYCNGCAWLRQEEWIKNQCAHVCKHTKTPTRNRIVGNPGTRQLVECTTEDRPKWCPGKETEME